MTAMETASGYAGFNLAAKLLAQQPYGHRPTPAINSITNADLRLTGDAGDYYAAAVDGIKSDHLSFIDSLRKEIDEWLGITRK